MYQDFRTLTHVLIQEAFWDGRGTLPQLQGADRGDPELGRSHVWWPRQLKAAELAETTKDRHNSHLPFQVRTVA